MHRRREFDGQLSWTSAIRKGFSASSFEHLKKVRDKLCLFCRKGCAEMVNKQRLLSGALYGCCLRCRHQAPQRNVVLVGLDSAFLLCTREVIFVGSNVLIVALCHFIRYLSKWHFSPFVCLVYLWYQRHDLIPGSTPTPKHHLVGAISLAGRIRTDGVPKQINTNDLLFYSL